MIYVRQTLSCDEMLVYSNLNKYEKQLFLSQVPRAGKRLKTLVICTSSGSPTKAYSKIVYQYMTLSLV